MSDRVTKAVTELTSKFFAIFFTSWPIPKLNFVQVNYFDGQVELILPIELMYDAIQRC